MIANINFAYLQDQVIPISHLFIQLHTATNAWRKLLAEAYGFIYFLQLETD